MCKVDQKSSWIYLPLFWPYNCSAVKPLSASNQNKSVLLVNWAVLTTLNDKRGVSKKGTRGHQLSSRSVLKDFTDDASTTSEGSFVRNRLVLRTTPFKSDWNDGRRSKTGNIYTENTALFLMLRGGVRVQSGSVAGCVFAWVTNTQASWLASGTSRSDCSRAHDHERRTSVCVRGVVDSTLEKSSRSHLAATVYSKMEQHERWKHAGDCG